MIGLIVLSTLPIALLVLISGKMSSVATFAISIIAITAAGMRVGGFDYNEYVTTIGFLQENSSSDIILERLFIAKDPIMLGIVDFIGYFDRDDKWPVFLSFAILGVMTKTIAALTLNKFSAIFMTSYIVLLSHGLEFAAIRSSVAIGFVILIYSAERKYIFRVLLWLLAVSSHVSAFVFLIGAVFGIFINSRKSIVLALAVSAAAAYSLSGYVVSTQRADGLINNQGSISAFLFPTATIAIFMLQLISCIPAKNKVYGVFAIAMGTSFGLVMPAVTISFRFMEMSWCILLFAMLKDISSENFAKGKSFAVLTFVLFTLLLCVVAFARPTMAALFTQLTLVWP